ncbi:hypothetical protein KCP74_15200 [Salmonella enterica subsp. enterica]|nr:hypothetical protein KCP74_15200 [Salmonella enterica subsp. enterica]
MRWGCGTENGGNQKAKARWSPTAFWCNSLRIHCGNYVSNQYRVNISQPTNALFAERRNVEVAGVSIYSEMRLSVR